MAERLRGYIEGLMAGVKTIDEIDDAACLDCTCYMHAARKLEEMADEARNGLPILTEQSPKPPEWRAILKEAIDQGLLTAQVHNFQIPVIGVVELRGGSKPNGINLLLKEGE